jgi:hypothetical protein
MGMEPTLGVLAHNVPTQDDSMRRDSTSRRSTTPPSADVPSRSTTPPSADVPSALPERGQHMDSGTLDDWTIRSKPPAPPSDPPVAQSLSALAHGEIARRRRQRLVLAGVSIFGALIFSLALLRALLG